jgi:glycosyltransferase involved in cell wall biosynthesis
VPESTLRVLHVTSGIDPRQGGVSTAIAAMVAAQIEAGILVSFVSTMGRDADPTIADRLRKLGANVRLVGPSTRVLAWHRDIKPVLRSMIPPADVVHIHGVWEEIQHRAARIAHGVNKPYLFTPHGMLDPWGLSQRSLKKRLYMALRLRRDLNEANAIHCTSETERELLPGLNLAAPVIVEKLIIDLSEFDSPPPRGSFRQKFSALRDKPMMLFLGRIHPKKGFDLLIPALGRMQPADAMLVIAGPDEDGYLAKVMEMVRGAGLAPRVIFTGMLYGVDRVAALCDADLFVLPSYQENFGIAVIESLAAGTPVVISDQVNIHRQIQERQIGGVVKTEVSALAGELTRWMTDAKLRRDASEQARKFVFEEYDRRKIAARWLEHYRGITSTR